MASNSYRTVHNNQWVTSALRTYLRDLYVEIPRGHFLESPSKFYSDSYDRFEMYALVELAGPQRIQHIPDLLYWYNYNVYPSCSLSRMRYYEYLARSQTPLLPLSLLGEEAEVASNYTIPSNIT